MAFPLLLKVGSFFSGSIVKTVLPFLTAAPLFLKKTIKIKEVKKYAPFIVVIAVVAYLVYRSRVDSLKITVDEIRGKEGKSNRLAILIAEHLGTSKHLPWYSLSKLSEDEEEVLTILETNKDLIDPIVLAYQKVSKSGDFISDVSRLFDAKQMERFNQLF